MIGPDFLDHASGDVQHVNPATGRSQRALPMAGPTRWTGRSRQRARLWRSGGSGGRRNAGACSCGSQTFIAANIDDLAVTATLETGTPLTQTPYVVQWAVNWLQDAAGWADKLYGQTTPLSTSGMLEYSAPEPYGVVAVIATWNGSIGGFGISAAAPLTASYALIVKPSELPPFGMIRAAELALEAGIPAGVVNVITADAEATSALVSPRGHRQDRLHWQPADRSQDRCGRSASADPVRVRLGVSPPASPSTTPTCPWRWPTDCC